MIKKILKKAALINVIFLLAMALAVPQALAEKKSEKSNDPISEVEAYLDQIRTKVDSIQQSVDGVVDPPLVGKIVETFSFNTCVSVETLMQVGLGAELEVPLKLEANANPGATVVQGKAEAHAQLSAAVSAGVNQGLGAGFSICFDLWKLGKALVEEFGPSTMGNIESVAMGESKSSTMEITSGPLAGLSPESLQFLIGLSKMNPAKFYNTLLNPVVNDAFGFNPDRTADVAVALLDVLQEGIQPIPNPQTMISEVESSLNRFTDILPFAEDINIKSLIGDPEKLNPCTYMDDVPFVNIKTGLIADCATLQGDGDVVNAVSWVVDTLDNLLGSLAGIKATLALAKNRLNSLKAYALDRIKQRIDDLKAKQASLCNKLDPIVNC